MRELLLLFLERFRGFEFVEGGKGILGPCVCHSLQRVLYLRNANKYAV